MKRYYKYLDKVDSFEGKNIIVTGANSGLGFETTLALVYKKAHVIMACRNLKKANDAKEKILKEVKNASLDIIEYDQSCFLSIDSFCQKVNEKYSQIDALICNAGIYFPKADYKTKDGFELTFGTNYLGTYYLLKKINPLLEKSKSKVIIVTSLTGFFANKKIKISDSEKLSRNKVYGYSKYCLSRLCYELDHQKSNVDYYLTHPGVCQTNIISSDQTGLPNWFSKIGHVFLYLFVSPSSKTCLTNICALNTKEEKKKFIKPRGIFAISGYPKKCEYPKYSKMPVIQETENYLKKDFISEKVYAYDYKI